MRTPALTPESADISAKVIPAAEAFLSRVSSSINFSRIDRQAASRSFLFASKKSYLGVSFHRTQFQALVGTRLVNCFKKFSNNICHTKEHHTLVSLIRKNRKTDSTGGCGLGGAGGGERGLPDVAGRERRRGGAAGRAPEERGSCRT